MKPYYEQDGITIYHCDNREVISELDYSVVITDPPYNVGLAYGDCTNDDRSDYREWCEEWFVPAFAKARAIALTPGTINVSMWCQIETPKWIIAWHKPAAMGNSPFGVCNWEPVLFWGRAKRNSGCDVVRAPIIRDDSTGGHPCPKPIAWASGLLKLMAVEQDTVLDPFSGSGTVLIAAKQFGCKAIGIEIDERYCEIAAKRLSQGLLSLEQPA